MTKFKLKEAKLATEIMANILAFINQRFKKVWKRMNVEIKMNSYIKKKKKEKKREILRRELKNVFYLSLYFVEWDLTILYFGFKYNAQFILPWHDK